MDVPDEYIWNLEGSDSFLVKDVRCFIDSVPLPDGVITTRWDQFIPKKVNILFWRVFLDRLLTRWNLIRKGVEVNSLMCPFCSNSLENIDHVLWSCMLSTSLWDQVFKWVDLLPLGRDKIVDIFR